MTPLEKGRLLALFSGFSHQTLTEDEHEQLQSRLRGDADARALWFLHQDLELGLKVLTQLPQGMPIVLPQRALNDAKTASEPVARDLRELKIGADMGQSVWLARRKSAIIAVALLGLLVMAAFGRHMLSDAPGSHHAVDDHFANLTVDDFHLQSPTHGEAFVLSEQIDKVIALHFLLKTECPFCLKLAHEYTQLAASNPNVLHLFIKPDSAEEIKAWADKINRKDLKNPPVIYRDPDARLADELGIPNGYEFHGQTVHYPALVVLGKGGKELFRFVGMNNADRMSPDDFLARLAMATDRR